MKRRILAILIAGALVTENGLWASAEDLLGVESAVVEESFGQDGMTDGPDIILEESAGITDESELAGVLSGEEPDGTDGNWQEEEAVSVDEERASDFLLQIEEIGAGDGTEDIPAEISGDRESLVRSGVCGEHLEWLLDAQGILTVSGTGPMDDYNNGDRFCLYADSDDTVSEDADCDDDDEFEAVYSPWFEYADDIVEIVVQDGVTSIGDQAFEFCGSLTSVSIPSSVVSVGKRAFFDDTVLASVVIPAEVESIGYYAFGYCFSEDGRDEQGESAPGQVRQIESIDQLEPVRDYTILGYTGSAAETYAEENGFAFLSLGQAAAEEAETESEEAVSEEKLTAGQETAEPEADLEAEAGTEQSASELETETEAAEEDTDPETEAAEEDTDPETEAAEEDTEAETEAAEEDTETETAADGTETETTEEETELNAQDTIGLAAGSSLAASGTCGDHLTWKLDDRGVLTVSGTGAMASWSDDSEVPWYSRRSDITEVVIESGVTSVGFMAFYYCTHLEKVTMPEGISSISNYAFDNCSALTSIRIPDSVISIGYAAFDDCRSLTSVVLGNSVSTINDWAFAYCTNLKSIAIPESVTYVSGYSFAGCTGLTGVTTANASQYYTSVNGILYNKDLTRLILVPANISLETFVVPDTVTYVDSYAVYSNQNVRSIIFPENLQTLNYRAIQSCESLERLLFLGNAPEMYSYGYGAEYVLDTSITAVYCRFSASGWSSLKEEMSEYESITWIDLDELLGVSTLSISGYSRALQVGKSVQLKAVLDPLLAMDFVWTSSNQQVAQVFSDGLVLATGVGSAVITVTSKDGAYTAKQTVTVTGESFSLPEYKKHSLNHDEISAISGNVCMQIPCEPLNGIYLLNGTTLSFFSLTDYTCSTVCTFNGCTSAYAENNRLYVLYSNTCFTYDLLGRSVVSRLTLPADYTGSAVGADLSGRIYIAVSVSGEEEYSYKLLLYSSQGSLLSETTVDALVYSFNGFDSSTGNFFMESYYDWIYWGYSHPGHALTMGNVTNNRIMNSETYSSVLVSGLLTYNLSCIEYLCQNSYLRHQNSASVLGGKYLVSASTTFGRVQILSSADLTGYLSVSRSAVEETLNDNYYDTGSIGVRAAYHKANDSIILYENGKTLNEYNVKTGEIISSFQTEHYVFNLLTMGDSLIIIEKEGGSYYLEIVNWGEPDKISVSGKTTMKVGESQQLSISSGKSYTLLYDWSSSDSSVVSVTSGGIATAWKAGKAVVTCKSSDGKHSAKLTVTVTDSGLTTPANSSASVGGRATSNISANNYTVWSSVANSYLTEASDGTLYRVEYISGTGVLVEKYSSSYQLLSKKVLSCELSLFGGFYSGADAYYLVFGQKNSAESDNCEIMRVVKYSKSWVRKGAVSVYGENTYIPFDAGSLRMTETNGRLYVYTCHEMYASSDGYHHQANMTFVINESAMKVEQSYSDVMNIAQAGYVSHSFNQFIRTDGSYVYRVDHGDASPRAVSITRCSAGGSVTDVIYTYALSINGYSGANATGVSVGGFELSSDNCLIVGNSVDQSDEGSYSASGQRNIFLTVTDKKLNNTKLIWLTNYSSGNGITPRTPQIVKLGSDLFLIMWEEYISSTKEIRTKVVTVDADGNKTSAVIPTALRLSDCQPIASSGGLVKWYVTDGSKVSVYAINPYKLTAICSHEGSWTTASAATVFKAKVQKRTCTVCGTTETRTSGSKLKATMSVNASSLTLKKKQSTTAFKVSGMASGDYVESVKSGNKKIVKVLSFSKTGTVRLKAQKKTGKTKLTITLASGMTKTVTVKVQSSKVKTTGLKVSPKSVTLKKGNKKTLKITLKPITSQQKVTYKSSNKKVATVNSKGVITAKKAGTAKITVKSGSVKVTVKVKVTK